MFLSRSLVHISYMYMIFFYVGTFGGLPPPPPPYTKKLATLLLPAFAHQKSGQMKMADSVPPTRYTKSPPLLYRHMHGWRGARWINVSLNGIDRDRDKTVSMCSFSSLIEPIAVSLVGMHDVFAEEYWTDFQIYSGSGICEKKWIDGRQDIKALMKTALSGYGQWKNATVQEGVYLIITLHLCSRVDSSFW